MATPKAEKALESKFARLKFSSILFHLQLNPALRRDTRLIRTPHYCGQFPVSLGKESPYIFSKVNPLNTDTSLLRNSLLCPWGKKALTFSLKSTRLIRTPHYYGQFALSLGKESPYIFSKVNPLNTDTSLLRTVCFVPGERKPLHFL